MDLENYKDTTKGNVGSNWMSASNTVQWLRGDGETTIGGSYLTGASDPQFKQAFATGLENLEIDISPLVEHWIAGTKDNHGVGIMLSSSYEAYYSASNDNARDPYHTGSIINNTGGVENSYYTKRFFGRRTQYFFKKPTIVARWDSIKRDDRGDFHYSSSLADGPDNLNTIYLYNYVRGILKDIPGIEKTGSIMVSLFSGNLGDTGPTGSSGQLHINSSSNPGNEGKVGGVKLHVTGGWVSTGIYSASLAITASRTTSGFDPILTLYDVWSTGSIEDGDHLQSQFHTGTIKPIILESDNRMQKHRNYLSITNLRNSYRSDETARFNLFVREKNWSPTIYTKASSNIETKTVHSASYRVYRTLDANDSVPYGTGSDNHTYLSYDVSGNYFDFNMSLLEPGYEYSFKFSFYDNSLSTWVEQEQAFKFRVEDYEY